MTPKEQYEARKGERDKLRNLEGMVRERSEQIMMLDTLDRFVTAVERIADALETSNNQPAVKSAEPQPSRRADWHYDSQGYCDNPGRGY